MKRITHPTTPPQKKWVKYQNVIYECSSWCATVEFIIYYDMSFGVHMHTSGSFCFNTFDLVMSLDLSRHRRQISQRRWVLDRQCWYRHCTARLV